MRFKNNVIDRLNQLKATLIKMRTQLNRGENRMTVEETMENMDSQIDNVIDLVSTENDDFANQFRG